MTIWNLVLSEAFSVRFALDVLIKMFRQAPEQDQTIIYLRFDIGGLSNFNLWFGDVQLFRADCTAPDPPMPVPCHCRRL